VVVAVPGPGLEVASEARAAAQAVGRVRAQAAEVALAPELDLVQEGEVLALAEAWEQAEAVRQVRERAVRDLVVLGLASAGLVVLARLPKEPRANGFLHRRFCVAQPWEALVCQAQAANLL
jgi:hypothetical protein